MFADRPLVAGPGRRTRCLPWPLGKGQLRSSVCGLLCAILVLGTAVETVAAGQSTLR